MSRFRFIKHPDEYPVVEVFDRSFTEDAIRITCPKDIPLVLPYSIQWSELNTPIIPIGDRLPYFAGRQDEIRWRELMFCYLNAFFPDNTSGALWIHIWGSRVIPKDKR